MFITTYIGDKGWSDTQKVHDFIKEVVSTIDPDIHIGVMPIGNDSFELGLESGDKRAKIVVTYEFLVNANSCNRSTAKEQQESLADRIRTALK